MRVVIQRVLNASVIIGKSQKSSIQKGLLIMIGIEHEDKPEDAEWLARKISQLRIFDDINGVMNFDVNEVSGELLVISQFTLHAKTKKGNRPSYILAAKPEHAIPLYEYFLTTLKNITGKEIHTGEFGAKMQIALINDGPVTILIDTKNKE